MIPVDFRQIVLPIINFITDNMTHKLTREDGIFAALGRAILKPQARDARKNVWISEAKWRLVNERVSALRDPTKDQSLIQRLERAIAASLKGDRRRRAEEAVAEVETLLGLDPPLHQEYWHRLKGWYQDAVDHAPPPTWVTLEQITADRVDLSNTPISVEPFQVDDSVPMEDEIQWTVKRLQNHRSGDTSRMWAKHLKGWLVVARNNEKEEAAYREETTESSRAGDLRNLRRNPTGRWWRNSCRRRSGKGD